LYFLISSSLALSPHREEHHRSPSPADEALLQPIIANLLSQHTLPESLLSPQEIRESICLSSWSQMMVLVSVVGGFLSQEVVKAVSGVGVPMMNVFVFSLQDGIGRAFTTQPAK
jgi:hypothetical protein